LSDSVLATLPYSQQHRLKFIDSQLMWGRTLNARLIIERFGVSRAQVAKDLKVYMELFPENIAPYEPVVKAYVPSNRFEPGFPIEAGVTGVDSALLDSVPILERSASPVVLARILSAIQSNKAIEFIYGSTRTPVGSRRLVAPSRIITAANRMHFRGYCFERLEYRDFVVARCLTTPKLKKPPSNPCEDKDWAVTITLSLQANPSLPKSGRALINKEFALAGKCVVTLPGPMLNYFLIDNNLPATKSARDEAKSTPWAYPVAWVSDSKEISRFLFN